MSLIVYEHPILLQHVVRAQGLPPLEVTVTLKASRHIPTPLENWTTLVEKTFIIEKEIMSIPVSIELYTLETFDVWYLEVFTRIVDRIKNEVLLRSGPFGISLGGIPPTVWTPRLELSEKLFKGVQPEVETIQTELGKVFTGKKPILETPVVELKVDVAGQKPVVQDVAIELKK